MSAGTHGSQRSISDSLGLKLQAVVRSLKWVLATELGSSGETVYTPNCRTSVQSFSLNVNMIMIVSPKVLTIIIMYILSIPFQKYCQGMSTGAPPPIDSGKPIFNYKPSFPPGFMSLPFRGHQLSTTSFSHLYSMSFTIFVIVFFLSTVVHGLQFCCPSCISLHPLLDSLALVPHSSLLCFSEAMHFSSLFFLDGFFWIK